MNKMIDRFAYASGLYCDGTPDSFDDEAITKHTQYVIAHIIERMNEMSDRYPDQSTARMALSQCIDTILEDFGIDPNESIACPVKM